jgi:hypothetical protein
MALARASIARGAARAALEALQVERPREYA